MLRIPSALILIVSIFSAFGCAYEIRSTVPGCLELLDSETRSALDDEVMIVPMLEHVDQWGFGLGRVGGSCRHRLTEPTLYRSQDRLVIRNLGTSVCFAGFGKCTVHRARGELVLGVLIVAPGYEPKYFSFEKSSEPGKPFPEKPAAEVLLSRSMNPRLDLVELRLIVEDPGKFQKAVGYWDGCRGLASWKTLELQFTERDKELILAFLEGVSPRFDESQTQPTVK